MQLPFIRCTIFLWLNCLLIETLNCFSSGIAGLHRLYIGRVPDRSGHDVLRSRQFHQLYPHWDLRQSPHQTLRLHHRWRHLQCGPSDRPVAVEADCGRRPELLCSGGMPGTVWCYLANSDLQYVSIPFTYSCATVAIWTLKIEKFNISISIRPDRELRKFSLQLPYPYIHSKVTQVALSLR